MSREIILRLEALYNRGDPWLLYEPFLDPPLLKVLHSHVQFQNEDQLKNLKTAQLRELINHLEADIAYYQQALRNDGLDPTPEVIFIQQQRDEDIRVVEIAKAILTERTAPSKCVIL